MKYLRLLMNLKVCTLFFAFFAIIFVDSSNAQTPNWLKEITTDVGLDSARGSRIWVVDVNNDNYPDLLWGTGGLNRNLFRLLLNIENPDKQSPFKRIFTDATESSGINVNRNPEKQGRVVDIAAMADFDNDGDMDLVTSIYYHRLQGYTDTLDPGDRTEILLNDGTGHFTLYPDNGLNNMSVVDTLAPGLINTTGISFLDYDYDGNIDIYFATWYTDRAVWSAMPDVLVKGHGDGSFEKIEKNGLQNPIAMYGCNVTDWNNDGWQDIITSPYCNDDGEVYKNRMDGRFINYAGVANYNTRIMPGYNSGGLCQWEAQPADFDNDGDMDLLQILMHGGYNAGEGRSHVTVNGGESEGYRYGDWDLSIIRQEFPTAYYTHLGDQGGAWLDIDNDGLLDILIGTTYPSGNYGQHRLYICKQNKDHLFDDISRALGLYGGTGVVAEAHSIEPADFDLDGDLDFFVSHQVSKTEVIDGKDSVILYMQIELFRNDIGNKSKWLAVKVAPPKGANQSGIGSRMTVCSGDLRQTREIQAGQGHFAGQMPFPMYVGLGNRTTIDSIIIRWPMSNIPTTTVYNPPINSFIIVDSNGIKDILFTDVTESQEESKESIELYPNPANDFIYAKIPPTFRNQCTLEIYNYIGNKLLAINLNENRPEYRIITENILPGCYILRITNKNGKFITKTFIINR